MRIDNLSIEAKTMLNDFVNQLEYDLIERKEDKKIEKIEYIGYGEDGNLQYQIIDKINEIIDNLNKLNVVLEPINIDEDKCKKVDLTDRYTIRYLKENK